MAPVARLQMKIKEVLGKPGQQSMTTDSIAESCDSTRGSTYLTLSRMEKSNIVQKVKIGRSVVWQLIR